MFAVGHLLHCDQTRDSVSSPPIDCRPAALCGRTRSFPANAQRLSVCFVERSVQLGTRGRRVASAVVLGTHRSLSHDGGFLLCTLVLSAGEKKRKEKGTKKASICRIFVIFCSLSSFIPFICSCMSYRLSVALFWPFLELCSSLLRCSLSLAFPSRCWCFSAAP